MLSLITTGRHDAPLMSRLAWSLLLCVCATPAWAQYEDSSDFSVEQADRVWLRALLDVRLVRGGPAPSWTDFGPGKLRYGGKQVGSGPDAHFERKTRLPLGGGVMTLPFSLEHVGPAWSPEFTITPSALNSWLWEDASIAGLEGEWWHETSSGVRVGALLGTGYGPDRMARLLALRGWAMGDGLSGINTHYPRWRVFDERDHRPAVYS